ncbi:MULTISPECIES: hypothetical protein [Streptomyces]|nr:MULTISPECIES: hypothetical protein [Streptomyces]
MCVCTGRARRAYAPWSPPPRKGVAALRKGVVSPHQGAAGL